MEVPPLPQLTAAGRVSPFPPVDVTELARAWRDTDTLEDEFFALGDEAENGHRGGRWVGSLTAFADRRAYMKPRWLNDAPIAAREKIASDLAFDIGVCVPPVILARRRQCPTGESKQVALSMRLFVEQVEWWRLRRRLRPGSGFLHMDLGEMVRQAAPIQAAKAYVFDCWVGQPDHDNNIRNSNIVLGYDNADESYSLVFFDYEMAFGHGGWGDPTQPQPFPEELLELADSDEIEQTILRIENLEAEEIGDIVRRVPEDFMRAEDQEELVNALLARRTHLRTMISNGRQPWT